MAFTGKQSNQSLLSVTRLFLCIMLALSGYRDVYAQEVTAKEPPPVVLPATNISSSQTAADLPDDPSQSRYPTAEILPPDGGQTADIDAVTQKKIGDLYILDGEVVIVTQGRVLHADHVEYNATTGDATATGHVLMTSQDSQERIAASHGTMNLRAGTGRFYDVSGSAFLKPADALHPKIYTNGNPFLFTGRMVVKSAPDHYDIYEGSVTTCELPNPDWLFVSKHFSVRDGKAISTNSFFRLLSMPVLYLPYVALPADAETRQSGFMIPVLGQTNTKGFVIGEEFYLVLNRSSDLAVGLQYYSKRGWEQSGTYRYKGAGMNFTNIHYSGLLDRGYTPSGGTYTNQGGEDLTISSRRDVDEHLRMAADMEYLSSYIYREAFANNFNQAVTTDINSIAYATYQNHGYVASLRADRYQGLKNVQTNSQIRIFHVPSLDFDVLERPFSHSRLVWGGQASITALKRVQENFTSDVSERMDVHPVLSLPLHGGGWSFRPSIGMRETLYTHSRESGNSAVSAPVELSSSLNRAAFEAGLELRAPVLEKTFDPGFLRRYLGDTAKHTIEPYMNYRYRSGINNFSQVLRFDALDVIADTDEVEYGVIQRLFLRPSRPHTCRSGEIPAELGGKCGGGTRETITWKLAQKRFFNQNFGGALVPPIVIPPAAGSPAGTASRVIPYRNVLDTTLDFSGVAFLTDQRSASPILSQMKFSATDNLDLEWDMNYDTHAGKFTQSNVFMNYHVGNYFGGISHARLNAPGRSTTGTVTSATSDFSQIRLLLGYGNLTKPGLSVAANLGIDLHAESMQYAAAQVSYNWNCCGIAIEYRKFELGPVRNENAYRFNFTLANIASAGNLRHAERLF